MKQIGLQLYSIRDVFLKDEASIRDGFRKIAEMGYTQAEPAGFLIDPALFARYAREAGVQIVNTHYGKALEDVEETESYNEEKDYALYKGTPSCAGVLDPERFAVFMVEEAHKSNIRTADCEGSIKAVFKIAR